jgi:hypothetical protein
MEFAWDHNKNKGNLAKHGVDFHEAKSIFFDENARIIFDDEHSHDEDRYILLGISNALRLLTVVHTYSKSDDIIRIISARKASKNETRQYTEFL